MKVTNINDWKHMRLVDGACVVYKNAPLDKDGVMYPPISWGAICSAYTVAKTQGLSCGIPQVYTGSLNDHKRVIGVMWEINAKWQNGEYDDLEDDRRTPIKNLVAETHQHLGEHYKEFVDV